MVLSRPRLPLLTALLLLPAVATAQVAAPAPAQPAPTVAALPVGAPVPVEADAAEAALRRVLRSGCHDGVADVRAMIGSPAAPWAPTVARLCGEVLQSPTVATLPPAVPAVALTTRPDNSGRGLVVVYATLYGIWLGIATDVLFTIDGVRSAIVPPLLGMAAGLGLSVLVTADHPLTSGQAWTIATGLDYGSLNGALWAGGLNLDAQGVVGTALATGLTGGAVGLLVADARRPRQGDIEVIRSGLLWGTISGLLGMAALAPDTSSELVLRTAGAAMDVGFVAGLALASSFDVSRNRVLLIDAGTLGGGLAGGGIAWLIVGGPSASGRVLAGAALGGMYVGMVAAALLTRNMDAGEHLAEATIPALYARDARGGWHWGTPGPAPLLDRFGQHVVGATFTAVGGSF